MGLAPRQRSASGNERLGRISMAGQVEIQGVLTIGKLIRLNRLERKSIKPGSWHARMLDRKPQILVAITPASKLARRIWIMLIESKDYKDPELFVSVQA